MPLKVASSAPPRSAKVNGEFTALNVSLPGPPVTVTGPLPPPSRRKKIGYWLSSSIVSAPAAVSSEMPFTVGNGQVTDVLVDEQPGGALKPLGPRTVNVSGVALKS